MKYLLIILTCVFLGGCSGDSSSDQPSSPAVEPQPIAYHSNFYSAVNQGVSFTSVESLAFEPSARRLSYGSSNLQFAEYWQPSAISGRANLPSIIIVHGGCWSNSFRINQSYPLATALALNGFNVWSVEYRATGDSGGGWPGTAEDVEAAISVILANASEYYSQRGHIVIGHSAGGHLGLLASANSAQTFDMVGVAAIANIIDYAALSGSCSALARSFMNGSPNSNPEQYELANPNLSSLSGDAFLFVGDRDGIVSTSQATNSGLPFEIIEGADHFDWIHPGTPTFTALLNYLLTSQ